MAQITGTTANDSLEGGSGNDTINGGAGYNVVQYRGSEYDYIVTRQNDGSVTVRAIAGTPYELDGTDTLSNIQLIKFLDGATERILDDVSNLQATSNLVVAFGAQTLGQTFIADQDWFKVTGGSANQAIHISFAGSDGSYLVANTANIYSNTWPEQIQATSLDASGQLAVKVYNNSLGLNSVNPYRFTVMRDLIGTDNAETLTAGATAEYLEGKGGNDSLVGSERSDYLSGGAGDDTLVGGAGDDTLIGGDGANDKDIAVFSGSLSEYSITTPTAYSQNPAQDIWWKVSHNSSGQIDFVKGVEVLRFADRDYIVDDYDIFAGTDIQTQTSFAHMGEVINGRFSRSQDDDWIAFDFGRGVVDKTTTLKVSVTVNNSGEKNLSFVNATGFKLQFTDLSDNGSKSSFDLNWFSGTREYLIKGVQWGPNAEGGAFGGNTTFLVMDGGYGDGLTDANQGAYSITISRYRAGTAGDDVLSTDGASEQLRADEVAGLAGNDKITGTDRAEVFDGGVGNDTINAGAGNDRLKGGAGTDALYGEAGDDTFLIAGESTVDDLFDGGSGTDTLSISNDVNLTGASFNSVEVLQGTGQRVTVSATQLAGFTTANNLIFSGANQDLSALGGSYTLEGTVGDDVLKAGAGDNVIRPFAGNNTVVGGAGNDSVVWERGWGSNWNMQTRADQVISSTISGSNYIIQGSYAGGDGSDTLKFVFNDYLNYVLNRWQWEYERPGTELPYGIDLSQTAIQGFENIELSRGTYSYGGVTYYYGPSAIYLSATQYANLTTLSGGSFVIKGGGTINLSAMTLANGATLSVSGDEAYTLTGTAASEALTTNGGDDSIVAGDGKDTISGGAGQDSIDAGAGDDVIIISNKSNVTDVISGGEGTDTLRITGADVDLSNATLSGIEKLEANSSSLALTQTQYDQFKGNLTGTAGLILKMTTPGQASVSALPAGFVGIRGTSGNDVLTGGSGADLLVGDAGNDSLTGGAGNDRLVAGAGSDTLRGGEGDDLFSVDGAKAPTAVIDGGAGTDRLIVSDGINLGGVTFSSVEQLTGTGTVTLNANQLASFIQVSGVNLQLADTKNSFAMGEVSISPNISVYLKDADANLSWEKGVIGTAQDDILAGGSGDDRLLGGRGADSILGGIGNDTLLGGSGYDTLLGGAGNDVFLVESSDINSSGTLNSDHLDGGEGVDTLKIDYSGTLWKTYRLVDGAVTNIEKIDVMGGDVAQVYLSADQFNSLTTLNVFSGNNARLFIDATGQDINLGAISTLGGLGVRITGKAGAVNTSALTLGNGTADWQQLEYGSLHLSQFESVKLSGGNDTLRVFGDGQFEVDAGAGNDWIRLEWLSEKLQATVSGGAGSDTVDVSNLGFVDLTGLTLVDVESINQGSTTLVVTAAQLAAWSFDGSGTKYTKVGNTIVGSASNDSYTGSGTEFFQGGRGDDFIANVNTAVFNGNFADYNFSQGKNPLTIEQARGSMTDGKDTLYGVMNLKFADTTVKIDDAPNENYYSYYRSSATAWDSLTHADYGKRISGKKDYVDDTDLYSATFVPNSPLAVEGSSFSGSNWRMAFWDVVTGGQIGFKSLVNGAQYGEWYSGMDANGKFLPMLNGKAYQGGDVVSRMYVDGGIQDYAFTLNFLDDYAGSVDTLGRMDAQESVIRGYVGDIGDSDWIRTSLIAGTKYEFKLMGLASDGGTLLDPKLELRDSEGRLIEAGLDYAANDVGGDDTIVFRPSATGTYYLAASDVGKVATGSWTLTQKSLDTVAGNTSTNERIDWSGANTFTVSSEINVLSDHDWFKVWFNKGITYELRALGSSQGGTLADPQLSVRSATGILLAQDDNSGGSSDAKVSFSAPDSGWYFLDAGASGNASKGTYILKGKTLDDDFANDRLTTGVVQVGKPLQGLISYNGDSDWLKVGLTKGQVYVIDLVGDMSDSAQLDPLVDPLLIVRDKDGEIIARYDDFTGSLNARAYFTPTADGLYFLEAKSAFKYDIGAYQLSVALAPPDDFASAMNESASALILGEAKRGEIGIPGDHDVFKVTLQQGNIYQVSVNGLANHKGSLADPYVRIFDSQGRLVDHDNNGGLGNDAQLYIEAKTSGTYFIEASSNKDRAMGTYEVAVAQRALPADEAPGNVGTTVFINPGDTFNGNLLTHNDQDWFGIRLEAGKDYVFKLQASHSGQGTLADPVLELHAGDGTTLKSVDNMLIGNEPAFVYTPTQTGIYYLAVKASDGANDVGSYTLVTRQPDDASNTKPGSQVIALDQVVTAGIQWSDGAYGVRAYDSVGLATDSDEDWYQFSATSGQILSVNVELAVGSSLSRPMVEIVSADNRSMAMGDGLETLNGRAVATFKAPEAGTYYARVIDGAGATGAYTLSLSAGDASDEDAHSPVQLVFATQGGVVQAQAQAKIGLAGDMDQFKVSLEQGHDYRIETLTVRDGMVAPLGSAKLALSWLSQGASSSVSVDVSSVMASPSFFDTTQFSATNAGTMTIAVAPLDSTQTGQYKLRVVDLGIAQPDDHPDRAADYVDANHGVMASNDSANGRIDSAGDIDLYAINLTVDNIYDFSVKSYADGLGTLSQADLRLLDARGQLVTSGIFDTTTGRNDLSVSVFETGRYYLAVSATDLPGNTGTFTLDTRMRGSDDRVDDIRADAQSGVSAGPGRTANGKIDYAGDHDWIRTTLTAGKVYVLDVLADGNGAGGTLKDATLRLLDAQGNEIALDDDSGAGLDAHLQFTAPQDADYYLDVGSNGTQLGTYTVRVRELYSGIADPLKSAQWYLSSLGLDTLHGQISGAGVTVGMIDDGIDTAHPDLQKQIDFALSYDTVYNTEDGKNKLPYPTNPFGDFHGTAVAGLIVAEQNNETGIVGVAPDAEIASVRVKWSWDQITEALGLQWQFDISNNSWGAIDPFADNFNSTTLTFAYQGLRTGVEDGRDGLGTVFVFSAGNSSGYGDNTNYHNFQNAREVIAVAATNADGSVASFSTPGASVLIGAYGVDLLTTDRHEKGLGLNTGGNYTNFTGTSAAAPVVSGVVALMLEANPHLGYRDVQKILAYSAWHPDNQDWKTNAAANFNLGGLQFNDQTGFGVVDAYSAVRLAQSWTTQSTAINEVSASARKFGLMDAIPDGDGTSYTRTFSVDANMLVEHVELGVDLRHTRLGDLVIELVSPNGTVSTLMNRPTVNAEQPFGLSGTDSGVPTHLLWDFSSVQFWGEQASGDWTIRIQDLRAEETGTLSSLSLRVYGERDSGNDVYVFTEEGFQSATHRVLSDEAGTDTLNAAPMKHDMYVDLPKGIIAAEGVTYTISAWSVLENVVTGIGSDNVIGNDSANLISTFEGNDTLQGGKGDDTLDGGQGYDVVTYAGDMAEFRVSWNPNLKTVTVVDGKFENGNEGTDTLIGIERIVFHDGELNLATTVGNKAPSVTHKQFDTPVFVGKGMGIDYAIPESAFTDAEQGNATDLQVTVTSASGGELPEWLSYDPQTRSFSGVPPQDYQGQLKLLVTAIDDFNQSVSDILTLQFGDNQAPLLDNPSELTLREDAATTSLGLHAPTDPEGKTVKIKVLEIPTQGRLLDKQGNPLSVDAVLSADGLSEVHYQAAADVNGDMGYFRYQATDDDGVASESAVHVFIDPVNDAPRFATLSSKLMVQYPLAQAVALDVARPTDPESNLSQVTVVDLPAMGVVRLDSVALSLNQVLSFDQLNRLSFTLAENVNGPIGGFTVRATDPQGLSTDWTLSLEVQGNTVNNTGTAGADSMYGSIAADTLYGMGGDDLLVGNAGNDRLLGGLGNDTLLGGTGNDVLDGSSGNDELDGGPGNDTMSGGPGNDTYIVDSTSDVVLEVISGGAGGKDMVVTSVSLTAPANIESLQALSGQALNLTGNSLDNILSGNELANNLAGGAGRDTLIGGAGNDTLDGGAGVDRLAGGLGDDTYYVDSRSDAIVELANEGTDTVYASASYTLPSQVEILILQEGGDFSAGGNSLNNRLEGNSGNNVLAGGLGKDTLVGGLGNDIYVLSDNLDTLVDTGGIDSIRSSLDIVLGTGFENAELVGITDAAATGNAADNTLQGNMGDNILEGKGGVDTLSGGAGSDQFVLSYNGLNLVADQISDFASGQDLLVVDLASFGISSSNLKLQSSGTVNADSFIKGPGIRALDPNDYFLLDTAQSLLKFDPDGSGPLAAMDVVRFVGIVDPATNGADLFIAV